MSVAVDTPSRTLGIAEAIRLTGLSRGALEARIRRGSLRASKEGGRLRIALDELYRQDLVPRATLSGTVSELLDRLEAQARRIGELEAENAALRGEPR